MVEERIISLIKKYAEKHGLTPDIVYGVIMQESNGDQFSVRYEKNYKWLEDPEKHKPIICSLDTEIMFQKTSFGLMQMMGGVFRELGFRGWLSKAMIEPCIQLDYGCKFLANKIVKYGFMGGICSYNSGSPRLNGQNQYLNIDYYSQVISYSHQFKS